MFVQVIQGTAKDAAGLKKQWERWGQELQPGASGYLGGTGGVTDDGRFIGMARFESQEAAKANSDRPEQGKWWEETSQYLDNVKFHDCTEIDVMGPGGSNDAGFVQFIQGKVKDAAKAREVMSSADEVMSGMRPDVLGGLVAGNPNGRYTQAIYFRSESEARKGEKEAVASPEAQEMMAKFAELADGEPEYYDISEPWMR
jgi:hypothetical protein